MERLRVISERGELDRAGVETPPFGPGFDAGIVERAERMEVWGTEEDEDREDYVEFRLMRGGAVIGVARIPGY